MTNLLSLCMGDSSGDGHGNTANLVILSNLTGKEFEAAYKKGVRKLKVDVRKSIASECDDRKIVEEDLKKFTDAGMVWDGDADFLWTDSFPELFLFTVKIGNPDFEYKLAPVEHVEIGGYGLF